MLTKRQIIEDAFGELRLAGYTFDTTAEEQQSAARRLEMMLAAWGARNIRLGYAFAADMSAIDLDAASGIPLMHARAVVCSLAMDMAAGIGKQVHPQTVRAASDGMSDLLAVAARSPSVQLPVMPSGAGNKGHSGAGPFTPAPDLSPLAADGGLVFRG